MMLLVSALLWAAVLFWFYLAYVTLNATKKRWRRAPIPVRVVCWATIAVAVVVDVAFNVVVGSALFLELPEVRRSTFTMRCKKWMGTRGWRGELADWFCHSWLNPFEPGHC